MFRWAVIAFGSTWRKGPLLMALAALSFTVMISAVKVARAEMSAFEVIACRSAVAMPMAAVYCAMGGTFVVHARRVFVLRALFGFTAMVGYFVSSKGLAVAELSLITKLQPILIAIVAPLVMGASERVGKVVWTALVVGLAGCAILIGPEMVAGAKYGLFALGATVLSAGAHLAIRGLKRESPRAVVLWFQSALLPLAVGGHAVVYGELVHLPPAHLVLPVLLCGTAAFVGQVLLTHAYQHDRAAVVAAAAYTAPVWAVLIDVAFFLDVPSVNVWIGGVLVVIAGLLVVRAKAPPEPAI